MRVTKALVIDSPWVDLILSGAKTWEMRSRRTSKRGEIALIRKGSGTVVGTATLTGCLSPLSPDEMIAAYDHHRIPEDMVRSGAVAKWTTPWVLKDARILDWPVAYRHPFGAVSWVNLEPAVSRSIEAQMESSSCLEDVEPQPASRSCRSDTEINECRPDLLMGDDQEEISGAQVSEAQLRSDPTPFTSTGQTRRIGSTEITAGNIKNNHIYLRSFISSFPEGLIGGSNKASRADLEASVDWGGPTPVSTDISGSHLFFRDRSWVRLFFEMNDAQPGDSVLVDETGHLSYRVSFAKRLEVFSKT